MTVRDYTYNYVIICLICWTHGETVSPKAPKADLCSSARAPPRLPHKTRAPRFLKTLPAIGRIRRFLQSEHNFQSCDPSIFSMSSCITLSNPTIFSKKLGRLGGIEQRNSAHRDSHQASFVETSSCNSCVMCSMTWVQKRMMAKRIANRKPFFPESVCCWYVVRHRRLMTLGKKTQWRRWA